MSRDTTAAFKTAMANDTIRPFILIDAEFNSGTVYVWNGVGELSWNSNTYQGFGNLLSISDVVETGEVRAAGLTIEFQALTAAYKSLALSNVSIKNSVTVRLGLFDSSGNIVADPETTFVGKMDEVNIEEGAEFSKFILSCENRLVELQKTKERRYTKEDQSQYQSGDTGLRHVVNAEKETKWGSV